MVEPERRRRGTDPRDRALNAAALEFLGDLDHRPSPGYVARLIESEPPGPLGKVADSTAQALADAFLAGEWTPQGLTERAAHVLGRRRAWVRTLVSAVLDGYHRPPTDRPRELGDFVAAHPIFRFAVQESQQRGHGTPRVRNRLAVPTTMLPPRWPVPIIDDVVALAEFLELSTEELDWFSDRRSLERQVRDERLRHYRREWTPTRSGGVRLLEAPKFRLKAMQRRILDEILAPIPVHSAAHGFHPGRSVVTFATPHSDKDIVIRLDIEAFFTSLSPGRIFGVFRLIGYPEPVAHYLTGLVTTVTPPSVLTTAPPNVRPLLAMPHLPQGAPTSPALANLCMYHLDRRLSALAASFRARYTRYADDLAFSSNHALSASALIRFVTTIATDEGLRVNSRKTRIRGRADRQILAGLVVNVRPSPPRREYDLLRALLHNASQGDPHDQNREGHPDFRAHVLGRIAWIAHTHPGRGAKLMAAFDQITW